MYNISLFRISINYTSDVWYFNPFLPPANDVPIPANRTGFLSFMTNSLRTVMTTATINKRRPRMLKARTSSNQPVIKSSSDYISWELKNFNINIETNLFIWFKRNILFQSRSEATRKSFFFVSPLASLYIMMIFFIYHMWLNWFIFSYIVCALNAICLELWFYFPICLCTSIHLWWFLFWIKSPCLFGYGKHESFSIRCTHLTTMISY